MDILKSIIEIKSGFWWRINGLIYGVVCVLTITVVINETFENKSVTLWLFIVLLLVWISTWIHKNRIQKVIKGKVGILICIHSKDIEVDERVREDFILGVKKSLDANNINNFADIIVVPYQIASRYGNVNDASKLLYKSKGLYLLFGIVKQRENRHVLDLTAYVRYRELTEESNERFKKDISSAWVPRYILENAENNFELFEISSEIVSLCSRYIIALSALASLDYTVSEVLLVNVRKSIKEQKYPDVPAIIVMRKNITDYLNTIYLTQALEYLSVWNETEDKNNLIILNEILSKVYGKYRRGAGFLTFNAIIEVVLKNNFSNARKSLKKIKKKYRNAVWFLNIGFLDACEEDENSALKNYKCAVELNNSTEPALSLDKIAEFENFSCWFLRENQHNPLPQFLLGVLNENFKGDLVTAVKDYRIFLNHPETKKFNASSNIAKKKVKELLG